MHEIESKNNATTRKQSDADLKELLVFQLTKLPRKLELMALHLDADETVKQELEREFRSVRKP